MSFDLKIDVTKDTASVEPFMAENALWIMAMVERMDAHLFHVPEHTKIEPTEAQKAASEKLHRRLEARMSQMDSNLDSINKMIQAAVAELPDELPDTLGKMARKRPVEVHLTKLRMWVLDNFGEFTNQEILFPIYLTTETTENTEKRFYH